MERRGVERRETWTEVERVSDRERGRGERERERERQRLRECEGDIDRLGERE